MPQNKPPVVEDNTLSSWHFEATENINKNELKLNTLLTFIKESATLTELKEKIDKL